MFKNIVILSAFLLIGCSNYLAEFEIDRSVDKSAALPICPFSLEKNCWTESLAVLDDCMGQASQDHLEMVNSGGVCRSSNWESTIDFKRPLSSESKSAMQPLDDELDFTFHNDKRTCFHFQGSADDFLINLDSEKFLTYNKGLGGTVRVRCLNGEALTFSSQIQKSGCIDASGKISSTGLPKMLFSLENTENQYQKYWHLRLLGAGKEPLDLFRCNLYQAD